MGDPQPPSRRGLLIMNEIDSADDFRKMARSCAGSWFPDVTREDLTAHSVDDLVELVYALRAELFRVREGVRRAGLDTASWRKEGDDVG